MGVKLPEVRVDGWPDPTEMAQRFNRAIVQLGQERKDPQASVGEVCGASATIVLGYVESIPDAQDRADVINHLIGMLVTVFQSREKVRASN